MNDRASDFSIFRLFLAFSGGCILLFLVAPLASLFLASNGAELTEAGRDAEVQRSIARSMALSLAGALFFSVLAIPFAYLLARRNFFGRRVVIGLIDLPVVIPHSAAGIALLTVLNNESAAGKALDAMGLSFIGEAPGIMLAMAFSSLPFLINSARAGFEDVPVKLENAAYTLGASPLRVFLTISVPLAWRSILTGLVMMWARGLSEFGAVMIIAYRPMTASVLIWDRFNAFGLRYARPVAVIFLGVCLAIFIVIRFLVGDKQRART